MKVTNKMRKYILSFRLSKKYRSTPNMNSEIHEITSKTINISHWYVSIKDIHAPLLQIDFLLVCNGYKILSISAHTKKHLHLNSRLQVLPLIFTTNSLI